LPTGETVTVLGEEPVTRITRTQYTYNSPDKSTPSAVRYGNDQSGTGKAPSPERGYPDDDVKLSRILTSSVTSSNSFRRSEISDSTPKYVSNTAMHDDVSRRPKTTGEKFVSSATAFLSRQKVTDEGSGTRTSPERGHITSTETERKCSSSTTTRTRQMTPTAVHTDSKDGKYSSRYEAGRQDTKCSLDSERNRDSCESKRSLQSNYDDESDGYRYSSRTVTESSALSSRRYVACLSSL
jgi:hypothetical protein